MDRDTVYCRDLVATYDYDRYILSCAVLPALRPALWAVYAFNHEIAKIRESVTDVHAGYIRLAWWHEALAAYYAGQPMPAHDVARALGRAITTYDLPADALEALIDARSFDLEGTTPATLDGTACYADASNTPLLQLAARITGARDTPGTMKALGTAYGLCGLVRALPYMASQKRCVLPAAMMHDLGMMPEQIDHLAPSAKLSVAIAQICARAQSALASAAPAHPLFRKHKKMTAFYLKRIARAGYNPFDARLLSPVPFLGLRLLF